MNTTTPTNTFTTIKQVDYGKINTMTDQANATNYDTDKAVYNKITENFLISNGKKASTNQQNTLIENTKNQEIQAFVTNSIQIPQINVRDYVIKLLNYGLNGLPILFFLSIFVYFLISIQFNVGKIQTFPDWLSHQTESFARENIIPRLPLNTR